MGFLDRLKKMFKNIMGKKNKIPALEENNKNKIPEVPLGERIRYTDVQPQGIDFSIEQYIAALLYQKENQQHINSYRALTTIGAVRDEEDYIDNYKEETLVKELKKNNEIYIKEQMSAKGKPAFYHIYNNNVYPPEYRLYLNCRPENVPDLAAKLINEMTDMESFYFKFNSKYQIADRKRSEQFVFYVKDDKQLNEIVHKIKKVQIKNPELFEKSNCVNPFMKNFDGNIAYAPEVKSDNYIGIHGESHKIDKSYNSLLSAALEDCFLNAAKDLSMEDQELYKKMGGKHDDYLIAPYVENILKDIYENDELKKKLIFKMKENLKMASLRNEKLEIKGIANNEKDFDSPIH